MQRATIQRAIRHLAHLVILLFALWRAPAARAADPETAPIALALHSETTASAGRARRTNHV